MIEGSGSILSTKDEEGNDLPFMTTDQILRELQRFGFIVFYDVKKNLPTDILAFLSTINNVGFNKITRVRLQATDNNGSIVWRPTILLFKSESNPDLLTFDCKLTLKDFNAKLAANTIMNVTHEKGMKWDWVTYTANIDDILNENTTDDDDQFKPIHEDLPDPPFFNPSTMTEYDSADVDDDEIVDDEPLEGVYGEP